MRRFLLALLVIGACSGGGSKTAPTTTFVQPTTTLSRAALLGELEQAEQQIAGCLLRLDDKPCSVNAVAMYGVIDSDLESPPSDLADSAAKYHAAYLDFRAQQCHSGSADAQCNQLNRDLQSRLLAILQALQG